MDINDNNEPKLFSARLYFRLLNESDASEKYVIWLNDPEVNQYLEARHSIATLDSCCNFIKTMSASSGHYFFGIFLKENNQHIGNIKIDVKPYYQTGELGLLLGEKNQWGKGYATESIIAMTNWGIEVLGLEKVEAGCYELNLGSLRAFLKSGYSVEGFIRQHCILNGIRQGCFRLGILKNESATII